MDQLEQNLGLTDHARFQVEHEKNGRTHRHIVWSRVDLDTMNLASDSFTYLAPDKTRVELEREFSHELISLCLGCASALLFARMTARMLAGASTSFRADIAAFVRAKFFSCCDNTLALRMGAVLVSH